jgi:hypothetical protein
MLSWPEQITSMGTGLLSGNASIVSNSGPLPVIGRYDTIGGRWASAATHPGGIRRYPC